MGDPGDRFNRRLKAGTGPSRKLNRKNLKVVPPGRPPGLQNHVTLDLKYAITEAAVTHGYDGQGLGGLTGYCYLLAEREPKTFALLLRALLPLTVNAKVAELGAPRIDFKSIEQAEAALRERGIPVSNIFKLEHHDPNEVRH